MLPGEKVYLRSLEPSDVALLFLWENDTSAWQYGDTLIPFSMENLRQYVSGLRDIYADKQLRLMICRKENDSPIGVLDLFDYNPRFRRTGIGIIIARPLERRKGFALDTLKCAENYAFGILGLEQLHCSIASGNEASIALFEKAGYVRCGERKRWFEHNGVWENEILYQRIKPNK
jgi:diamine N-acetyltransferase